MSEHTTQAVGRVLVYKSTCARCIGASSPHRDGAPAELRTRTLPLRGGCSLQLSYRGVGRERAGVVRQDFSPAVLLYAQLSPLTLFQEPLFKEVSA